MFDNVILAQPSMGDWSRALTVYAIGVLVLFLIVIAIGVSIVVGARKAKKTKRESIRALSFWITGVVGAISALFACSFAHFWLEKYHVHGLFLYVLLPLAVLPALLLERKKPRWGGIALMVGSVLTAQLNLRQARAHDPIQFAVEIAWFAWFCILLFLLGGSFYFSAGKKPRQFSIRQMLIWVTVCSAICGLFTEAASHAWHQSHTDEEEEDVEYQMEREED